MKRLVFVFAAAALCLGAVEAFASGDQTYIGLYSDSGHTTWCASCSPLCTLTIYAWVLPSIAGVKAVEFDVSYPSNVIPGAKTVNCDEINCIGPVYSYVFFNCQVEWVWIWRQEVYLTSTDAGEATIVPPPGLTQIRYNSCEVGYPVYPMTPLNVFYFNGCGPLSVQTSTWSAIKALFH